MGAVRCDKSETKHPTIEAIFWMVLEVYMFGWLIFEESG